MEEKIIKKTKVNKLLEKLNKDYQIFAPVEKDNDFLLSEISTPGSYQFPSDNYKNVKISPKGIFFPQSETLFEFNDQGVKSPELSNKKNLIFGIRPCDARAIGLLDKVFLEDKNKELIDPYYSAKREEAIIISTACIGPRITCFCTSLNGKPDGEDGSDIILFDLGEEILFKPVSDKGKEFIKKAGGDLAAAKKSNIDKKNKLVSESIKKIKTKINTDKTKEKLDKSFDAEFWKDLHQKCLGCGICTYLCPTCHCFDISDELGTGMEAFAESKGKRLKCWDSCMYPLFTLHASGHNPRHTHKERFRQRIMHKFNYCPSNFKETFCVGCGRCVSNCPVNLDIREVVKIVNE